MPSGDWAIIETLRLIKGLFCVAVPRVDVHAEWPLALGQADDADDLTSDPARVGTGVGHRRLASRELSAHLCFRTLHARRPDCYAG